MANKPHHGMRGLMAGPKPLNAGAHMPLRKPSGGDRISKPPKSAHQARNSDTRPRSGAEGNGKGTVSRGKKGAGTAAHKATAGRGGTGAMHSNRLSESPGHEWFEKLGC